jgi:TPR repeat protein
MQTNNLRDLRLAAAGGNAAAQFNLGVLYDSRVDDNGHPIAGNRKEAMKWMLAAAEQGLPRAQSRVAEMYAAGPDPPEDHISACAWFLVAATQLSGIYRDRAQSGYERVSSYLTPRQLATARRLAGSWQPKTPDDVAGTR